MSLSTSAPWKLFLFSSIGSCTAELCTVPVDVVKTRLQLSGEGGAERAYRGTVDAFRTILRQEGVGALFKGTAPALLRQSTYGSLRIGLYEPIKRLFAGGNYGKEGNGGKGGILVKLASGVGSGSIAATLCAPTDRVKVLLQAQRSGSGSADNVVGIRGAVRMILETEGARGLYRGAFPTAARAGVLAAVELGTYDEAKERVVGFGRKKNVSWLSPSSVATHLTSSLIAGFFATVATAPIDTVRARIFAQSGSTKRYSGVLDAATTLVRTEGVSALWKGFTPNYLRIGPHVTIMFLVIEQLRKHWD